MHFIGIKRAKIPSVYLITSFVVLFLFLATPLSTVAENASSIDTLRQMGKAFAGIAEKASPAVVGIQAVKVITLEDYPALREWPFGEPFNPFEDDFFDYFFRRQSPQRRYEKPKTRHAGSGIIVMSDGYILTNNHLVGGAEKVTVRLADNREFTAKIIGADRDSDVAVIKIEADNLKTLELGDSDALEVGEWVVAIGNPFGLTRTVTAGIVSAKGRSGLHLAEFEDFIQTDAAINFGNSGGPLLNLNGKVIGINTAIIGPTNVGIGLAIPINMAKAVYKQLIDTGTVVRGQLGIVFIELTPVLADALGLEKDIKGVTITGVLEDSPAEKAGLKRYDVIVEFESQPVVNGNEFRNYVAMLKPGTEVKIGIIRDGKRETITAELGKYEPETQLAGTRSSTYEELGIEVQNITDDVARRLGYEGLSGVVVARVESGSEAERKGIRAGMLIMEVDREPIENSKEFYEAIKKGSEKGTILLLINDGKSTFLVPFKVKKE